jgi:hypothetical protein
LNQPIIFIDPIWIMTEKQKVTTSQKKTGRPKESGSTIIRVPNPLVEPIKQLIQVYRTMNKQTRKSRS